MRRGANDQRGDWSRSALARRRDAANRRGRRDLDEGPLVMDEEMVRRIHARIRRAILRMARRRRRHRGAQGFLA